MKIFDCFMYFDEDLVLDLRLNFLNKYVDKFVIVESEYNHKGEKRYPLFDIKKFSKFEKKIEYILINDIHPDIEKITEEDNKDEVYRKSILNAYKRENLQRNKIVEGIKDAKDDDWIIISDLDEIPNLNKIDFNNTQNKLVFFKQAMMYYKFNLKLENHIWVGSKACKMKNLISPQWIRNIKDRNYKWWRFDTLLSNMKYKNIKFVENGGWHFSYLKTSEGIEKKLKSYLHHIDYDNNPIGNNRIKEMINNKKPIYNLKADQRENKFDGQGKLIKIDINLLPSYIIDNKEKFIDWIEE